MGERKGIGGGGNWIIDHVKIIDTWPAEGTLANILEEKRGTGGAPYNVLLDVAKFGCSFPLEGVGLVGHDSDGDYILDDCYRNHIDSRFIKQTEAQPTSYTDVMTLADSGRRTFFHNRGANKLLTYEHFPFAELRSRIFHVGYLLLMDGLDAADAEFGTVAAKVLNSLQLQGIKTSVDVVSESSSRFNRIVTPALKYIDYLILNEIEAGRTTGHHIRAGDALAIPALQASAGDLLDQGVKELVIIHMPEGGYLLTKSGEEIFQPALQLPPGYIKGAAGAGDAFCAGALYGLHESWSWQDTLQLAVAAAAANLSDPTCTDGMRSLSDTQALLKEFPFQDNLLSS